MKEILIREFTINEFYSINNLMDQVHRLHVNNRFDIYKESKGLLSKEDFEKIISDKNMISILAEINETIVGFCIITIKNPVENKGLVSRRVAYMEDLVVDEDYRGNGIGKKLFVEAKKRAIEFNVDSLELMVWEFNKEAIKFYKNQNMKTRSRIMEIKM